MLAASTDNMEELDSSAFSHKGSDIPKPHLWLGVKNGLNKAKLAIENKNLTLAEQRLREVLEFAPAEFEAWHILAAILNRNGQADEARQCLKRVMKLKETHISSHPELPASKRMAKLLWTKHEPDAALTMLAELLLQSPDDKALLDLQQTWTTS